MALGDPFQILLILGVLAVILIWGPQKIPELARSIGKARKEFDDASKGLMQPPSSPSITVSTPDSLIDTAQKLGISTQGKTRQDPTTQPSPSVLPVGMFPVITVDIKRSLRNR